MLKRIAATRDAISASSVKGPGRHPRDLDFNQYLLLRDIWEPLSAAIVHWGRANRRLFVRYFGPAGSGLDKQAPIFPGTDIPSASDLDVLESDVRGRVHGLEGIAHHFGGADVQVAPERDVSLAFIEGTGLVDSRVLEQFQIRLRGLRDRRNVPRVSGAAKELVEAVNHGALHVLGETAPAAGDFGQLAKATRQAISSRMARERPQTAVLERISTKLIAGLATIEQALAEMRNAHGEGHGGRSWPNGLDVRHGQLARDSALAYCRFVVASLAELGLA